MKPRSNKPHWPVLKVDMPPALLSDLKALARAHNLSAGEVIRRLIQTAVQRGIEDHEPDR